MSTVSIAKPSKALNAILWIVQVLLAAIFLMAGFMKLSQPIDQLATSLPWVTQVPSALVRFIGLAEVLGGLGLLLPSLLRIQPRLTVLAAWGLVLVMLLASAFHLSRGESMMVGPNLVIAALAAFVAWGRSKKALIQPKNALAA
ncbi:MAG TPA: DoxX family protein [Hymenobacter sp.]|jgi:uncharacterized membrane protein YphA (DoxX/SURF4 family)